MKILVTGGYRFIGSNLVDELVELEHDVCVTCPLYLHTSIREVEYDKLVSSSKKNWILI